MASAPTGLVATSTSSTGITITWTIAEAYLAIELQYQNEYIGWTTKSSGIGGTTETYSFTSTPNIWYEFRVRGKDVTLEMWSDWSNTDWAAGYADIVSTGISFSGTSGDLIVEGTYDDTVSATITFEGFSLDAGSISTTYAYYLGNSAGVIYEHSDEYEGDAGNTIPCEWQGKETNFVDQFKELESRQKVVHFARLYYVDKSATVPTIIKLSTDGGATWAASTTKSIGTGDGKSKSSDFFFEGGPISGQFITPKIENNTSDKELQWTALALYFEPGAEDFVI